MDELTKFLPESPGKESQDCKQNSPKFKFLVRFHFLLDRNDEKQSVKKNEYDYNCIQGTSTDMINVVSLNSLFNDPRSLHRVHAGSCSFIL